MKRFLFLAMLLCAFLGFSQEKTLLKGQLVFLSMNTTPINIINIGEHTGTINNKEGEFEIEVALGDELLFSSVQYEPYRVIITQDIINKRWIRVELSPMINELEEITLSNISLSGSLKADMGAADIKEHYDNKSFGFEMPAPKPTVEERRLYTATSGGPLGLLINVLSGRLKKLRKLKALAELTAVVEKATQSLDEDFFMAECGIPAAYISSFMYFCAKDPYFETLINQDQKLTLAEFFKTKAKGYRERRGWQ